MDWEAVNFWLEVLLILLPLLSVIIHLLDGSF